MFAKVGGASPLARSIRKILARPSAVVPPFKTIEHLHEQNDVLMAFRHFDQDPIGLALEDLVLIGALVKPCCCGARVFLSEL